MGYRIPPNVPLTGFQVTLSNLHVNIGATKRLVLSEGPVMYDQLLALEQPNK